MCHNAVRASEILSRRLVSPPTATPSAAQVHPVAAVVCHPGRCPHLGPPLAGQADTIPMQQSAHGSRKWPSIQPSCPCSAGFFCMQPTMIISLFGGAWPWAVPSGLSCNSQVQWVSTHSLGNPFRSLLV